MEEWGFLASGQYLIHDRDGKYCPAFQQIIDAAGITRVPLPPRSPNLNAYAERWVRSVKEECLARVMLFGEASLHHALAQYMAQRWLLPLFVRQSVYPCQRWYHFMMSPA